jgi:hypothetical protein
MGLFDLGDKGKVLVSLDEGPITLVKFPAVPLPAETYRARPGDIVYFAPVQTGKATQYISATAQMIKTYANGTYVPAGIVLTEPKYNNSLGMREADIALFGIIEEALFEGTQPALATRQFAAQFVAAKANPTVELPRFSVTSTVGSNPIIYQDGTDVSTARVFITSLPNIVNSSGVQETNEEDEEEL